MDGAELSHGAPEINNVRLVFPHYETPLIEQKSGGTGSRTGSDIKPFPPATSCNGSLLPPTGSLKNTPSGTDKPSPMLLEVQRDKSMEDPRCLYVGGCVFFELKGVCMVSAF